MAKKTEKKIANETGRQPIVELVINNNGGKAWQWALNYVSPGGTSAQSNGTARSYLEVMEDTTAALKARGVDVK